MAADSGAIDSPARREALRLLAVAGAGLLTTSCRQDQATAFVEDVAHVARMPVGQVLRPASTPNVQAAVRAATGGISIGGARYSMGGQIAADDSLHLDMRGMRRLVWLDAGQARVRVQAGMPWRDLLDHLDPHDLSPRIMQSYSNFSIGGSVSVNCHGRYVGAGPLAHSLRALQMVMADGSVQELDRRQSPELFAAAIGGYGGLGVITEVELELARNERMQRQVERVRLADYPDYFRAHVAGRDEVLMHNADLVPPDFDAPLAISWLRSDAALTHRERLIPRDLDYSREQNMIWAVSELPASGSLRERFQTERLLHEPMVQMRNREASLDAAALEPRTRRFSTYLLQEYFIPVAGFVPFARLMTALLQQHRVQALNVSIRHSPPDRDSLLAWAREEVFSFVLYHKQDAGQRADDLAGHWTRQLIDAALMHGGRYYLPYRLHATREQFLRAYPEATAYATIKRQLDPLGRFRNRLWEKYLPTA